MCGIVGIVGTSAVNQRLYDALTVLQHRGQDAAGIATSSGEGELCVRKGSGLVRDVFQQHHMLELKGNVGIGHVRYPTAGCDSASEAQPFYVNAPYGICLGAQRQPHQRHRARRDPDPRGPASSQHHLRFGSAAERVRLRAAARRHRAHHPGGRVCRVERRVPPLPRRLRGGRHDHRPRHSRLSRSERHPPAGARRAAHAARHRVDARLRERGARHASRSAWCATWRRARPCSSTSRAGSTRSSASPPRATHPASSSTSTSRAPTRRSTTSPSTGRACAWAIASPTRSCASGPTHDIDVVIPDSGHQPHQRAAAGAAARRQVPRRLHQEPLHRPYLHHAGPGGAREVGAPQAERHRPRVPRQEGAAGG